MHLLVLHILIPISYHPLLIPLFKETINTYTYVSDLIKYASTPSLCITIILDKSIILECNSIIFI